MSPNVLRKLRAVDDAQKAKDVEPRPVMAPPSAVTYWMGPDNKLRQIVSGPAVVGL